MATRAFPSTALSGQNLSAAFPWWVVKVIRMLLQYVLLPW